MIKLILTFANILNSKRFWLLYFNVISYYFVFEDYCNSLDKIQGFKTYNLHQK